MAGSIKRAVTSYDVAKAAGVSQSAVSRAFTDGAKISPATREKVRKVAAELGYRPSFIAQSLITRRSNLIGIVVPGLVNPFYSAVLDELSHKLNLMGYRVLLFSMYRDDDTTPIMEEILRHRAKRWCWFPAASSHFAQECQHLGLPVLLLNRKNDSQSVSSVTSDNPPAARRLPIFCWMPATGSWRLLPGEIPHPPAATGKPAFATGWIRAGPGPRCAIAGCGRLKKR